MVAHCIATLKWLLTATALVIVSSVHCEQIRSEDIARSGVITYKYESIDTTLSECFVPVKIGDRFLVIVPTGASINSKSKIGIQLSNSEILWSPLHELVDGGDDNFNTPDDQQDLLAQKPKDILEEAKASIYRYSEGGLYFFPLVENTPENDSSIKMWEVLRERAIDLVAASEDLSIPKEGTIVAYELDAFEKLPCASRRVEIGSKEEFYNVWKTLNNEPLYHFELKCILRLGESGAPIFRDPTLDNEHRDKNFLGIYRINSDDRDKVVMLHPLTILKLYQQHLDPRKQ